MEHQIAGELKSTVRMHWEQETCGTRYGSSVSPERYFAEIEQARYSLEPYIVDFAGFSRAEGKEVLEIGTGAGTDFANWVRHGAAATGVDLTKAAIELTRQRLEVDGIDPDSYRLLVADAEDLPFDENRFDIVYSWGVLHHSPDTELAFKEAFRVLKPGGVLKAMIYHVPCWAGWLLWLQYGLLRGRPHETVKSAIFHHLESPGTKAYTLSEADALLARVGLKGAKLWTKLGPGDLLTIKPSKRYQSRIFKLIWRCYPRWLVRRMGDQYGLCLLIEAEKPLPIG
jgi:SAM-dependent methyltransferase